MKDRPTKKMMHTAAAIRREARAGVSMPDLAARFDLDYPVLGRVLKARTVNGASVVLFNCKALEFTNVGLSTKPDALQTHLRTKTLNNR